MSWFGTVVARPLICATCGRSLERDPDDDPTGDAGRPICGECYREREFDADWAHATDQPADADAEQTDGGMEEAEAGWFPVVTEDDEYNSADDER